MSDAEQRPSYRLDHVCLAVRNLGAARDILKRVLGYAPRTQPVENTRQQVHVQFLAKDGSLDIKLIAPTSNESPLVEFLKQGGGGLHHLAFRTESVADGVEDLAAHGAKIVAPPQPGEAFDDALIAFAFVGAGLNLELLDTDRRRSEIEGSD